MRNATRLGMMIALGASTVLGACGGKDKGAMADSSATAQANAGTAPAGAGGPATPADSTKTPSSPVPTSTAQMTDPEILSLTNAANTGEVATSQIAIQKATNPDVKKFAQQMIADHTKMISDGNTVAKAQSLTPAAGAKDSITKAGDQMVSALKAAPKGMAFDTAYVNGQVMAHTATLAMVQKAQGAAQNASLKQMLTKAAPEIQQHLDEAKSLQSKLTSSAGAQ